MVQASSHRKRPSTKKRSSEEQEDEVDDGEGLGLLEAFVRLWVAESCLEIAGEAQRTTLHLVAVLAPLLVASKDPSGRSEYVMLALCVNAARRLALGRFWEALVDATTATGVWVERRHRAMKRQSTSLELETEVVATCASTVRWEMALAFAGPTAAAVAAMVAFAPPPRRLGRGPTRSAVTAEDAGRLAVAVVAALDVAALVVGWEDIPAASGSRLFFTMPVAVTEALDEWIFMDIVFAGVVLTAVCLGVKRDVIFEHRGGHRILWAVGLAYRAIQALLTWRALVVDRRAHAEVDTGDDDKGLTRAAQRALHFEFVEERAASRFATFRRTLVTLAAAAALGRLVTGARDVLGAPRTVG